MTPDQAAAPKNRASSFNHELRDSRVTSKVNEYQRLDAELMRSRVTGFLGRLAAS